jgi:predicted enzyme related to lactoylglutathione lyase
MKLLSKLLVAAGFAVAGATVHAAGVTLNAVRVGAKDPAATARFYQTAFGMYEVQRIAQGNSLEIMLNFGATADAARANPGSQVVIQQRAADDGSDAMAHVIFNVTDMAAAVKAAKAAGAKAEREPFQYGTTGIWIGLLIDPAGNHIELLQFPAASQGAPH